MKPSTLRMIRVHGARLDRALHNYVYFSFYDSYVKALLWLGHFLTGKFAESAAVRFFFREVFKRYHAKVVTMNEARKILSLKEDVALGPDSSGKIIPYPYANKIILEEPWFIAVMDCPCRLARKEHCEPVNVCMAVGRTTAQFWIEHGQKYNARRVTQEEALAILEEARRKGNITTSWFKVATGGRTSVICSCCSCCCGGIEAMRVVGRLRGMEGYSNIANSGYSVVLEREGCGGCGECGRVCMFGAVTLAEDGKSSQLAENCMGCGLCVEFCGREARKLVMDPGKGVPLDIDIAGGLLEGSRHGAAGSS